MTADRTNWRDHDWQLIRGEPVPVVLNHALDEVLVRRVGHGERSPTLRFWDRQGPEIVLGRFQSVRNEVQVENTTADGIEVNRRITGGGAMFVEPQNAVTYSIYAPADLVKGLGFADSYAFLDEWVIEGLRSLGIDAWYEPINDITSSGGKIGGAAQARRHGAVLHHVTMAYDMAPESLPKYLRIGQEKLSDKGITSANRRVGPLRLQTQMERLDIIEHLIGTFRERHGLTPGQITEDEMQEAEELVRTQFGTEEWRFLLP
ncbi:MAG: lipoate--protein ligase family protein [Sphaerobacteraceae bacterium]|nr:MAG: lipoate--protein ligase family protein [Sphaerobacteraceae bacterium]